MGFWWRFLPFVLIWAAVGGCQRPVKVWEVEEQPLAPPGPEPGSQGAAEDGDKGKPDH